MNAREVFPNAPLAMVVGEVQFSYVAELNHEATMANVFSRVRDRAPVMAPGRVANPEAAVEDLRGGLAMLAQALDRQSTVSMTPTTLAVAMSGDAYTQYEDSLRPLIEDAYGGLVETVPGLLITRIGLRYLDEIRAGDGVNGVADWRRWIDASLLGGTDYLTEQSGVLMAARSVAQYLLPGDRQVILTHGPFRGSGVVGPDHPFHKEGIEELMYVLDVDSSWQADPAETLSGEDLLDHFDSLHLPAQAVFASAVTDEARASFRRVQS